MRRLDTVPLGNRNPWVVLERSSDTVRACLREQSPEAAWGVTGDQQSRGRGPGEEAGLWPRSG